MKFVVHYNTHFKRKRSQNSARLRNCTEWKSACIDAIYCTNFGQKILNECKNVNELYPIVRHVIIVEICGQTEIVTSFIEHVIRWIKGFKAL